MPVFPKKHLGQHFLKDENIARKIVSSLSAPTGKVIEVGPGMGVLTKYLAEREDLECYYIETDEESVRYLGSFIPENNIIHADFLKFDIHPLFPGPFSIIGNFPYNISSQIFFKVLENRQHVVEVVGMIQKEVADRIVSGPGSRDYGILSVLLQTYFDIQNLFHVNPSVFHPPPRVRSSVVRMTRNDRSQADCDEELLFRVVKKAFNQRRKMLRNALKELLPERPAPWTSEMLHKRAEQLSPDEFIRLTRELEMQGA